MKKAEADVEVAHLEKEEPDWFCPMINAMCRKDCINFVGPHVYNKNGAALEDVKSDSFEVEGHVCSNAQFIGVIPYVICEECGSMMEIVLGRRR